MSKKMLVTGSIRDQDWLEDQLATIWYKYFSDVTQENKVVICYGRKAKRRLGAIGLDRKEPTTTIIYINPIYQDESVPEYVVYATIIHEMIHYAHGFHSPHQQKHKHPHSGGVIKKEFAQRGLESLYVKQQKWLKEHWLDILRKYYTDIDSKPRRRVIRKQVRVPWWMRIT